MYIDALKAFARIGFFVGGCGLVLLFFEPPNRPEWFLSLCSALIGLTLVLGAVILVRRAS
jgi:hypothetical protein